MPSFALSALKACAAPLFHRTNLKSTVQYPEKFGVFSLPHTQDEEAYSGKAKQTDQKTSLPHMLE